MRPHDVSGACGHTLHGALYPAGVRASGQRAATPPAAIGRDRPGNCSPPSAGYSSAPLREPVPPWKCRHPAESSEGAGPENSSATPSAGCSSTPVSRVGAAEDMRAENSGRSRSGERVRPPSAGCSFRLGRCRIPHLPSSGSHAPDQVPDSVTDIDRPAAGADPPRGHDAPLLLVDLSNGEFSTPAVGSSVRRLAMPQEDR